MNKAQPLIAMVVTLFCAWACACASAQDGALTARKVTLSLQTGTPMAAEKTGVDSAAADPVAKQPRGSEVITATVVAIEPLNQKVPRQRRIDYSEDQIVIVGLAADSTEVTRSVMIDPRLVRAEAILGEDDLASTRLYRQSVDFSVALDDPEAVRLRILKPWWDGSAWQFDLIAEMPLL